MARAEQEDESERYQCRGDRPRRAAGLERPAQPGAWACVWKRGGNRRCDRARQGERDRDLRDPVPSHQRTEGIRLDDEQQCDSGDAVRPDPWIAHDRERVLDGPPAHSVGGIGETVDVEAARQHDRRGQRNGPREHRGQLMHENSPKRSRRSTDRRSDQWKRDHASRQIGLVECDHPAEREAGEEGESRRTAAQLTSRELSDPNR
jgi:hypothetical protein